MEYFCLGALICVALVFLIALLVGADEDSGTYTQADLEREIKSDLTTFEHHTPDGAKDWDVGESYGEWDA